MLFFVDKTSNSRQWQQPNLIYLETKKIYRKRYTRHVSKCMSSEYRFCVPLIGFSTSVIMKIGSLLLTNAFLPQSDNDFLNGCFFSSRIQFNYYYERRQVYKNVNSIKCAFCLIYTGNFIECAFDSAQMCIKFTIILKWQRQNRMQSIVVLHVCSVWMRASIESNQRRSVLLVSCLKT